MMQMYFLSLGVNDELEIAQCLEEPVYGQDDDVEGDDLGDGEAGGKPRPALTRPLDEALKRALAEA